MPPLKCGCRGRDRTRYLKQHHSRKATAVGTEVLISDATASVMSPSRFGTLMRICISTLCVSCPLTNLHGVYFPEIAETYRTVLRTFNLSATAVMSNSSVSLPSYITFSLSRPSSMYGSCERIAARLLFTCFVTPSVLPILCLLFLLPLYHYTLWTVAWEVLKVSAR